jgi:hypothetical protein
MAKKYQVFISSTFDDLKEHRDAVVKAVLQLGHLPVGMEMFNAGDQTQWETIKSYIDSSDYYLVILAHRYGSKDPASGLSYTEKEYEYAGERDVPRLGFVIDKTANWPAYHVEADAKTELDAFKKKVGSARVIKFWDNTDKLTYHVALSLANEININPRVGWVRATEAASPQVAEELARLSKENKELQTQLMQVRRGSEEEFLESIVNSINLKTDIDAINLHIGNIFAMICSLLPNATTASVTEIILKEFELKNGQWRNVDSIVENAIAELQRLGIVNQAGQTTQYRYIDDAQTQQREVSTKKWELTEKGTRLYRLVRYSATDK